MKCLGIDTSTNTGSISLVDEEKLIATSIFLRNENILSLELIHILSISHITISEIDLIAVSSGPGSFTGLRASMALGYGVSKGLNIPIISIPTLDCLSYYFIEERRQICPIIDIKRGRISLAIYKGNRRVSDYIACKIEDLFPLIQEETVFLGSGAILYKELIRKHLGSLSKFATPFKNTPLSINTAFLGIEYFKKGRIENGCIYP